MKIRINQIDLPPGYSPEQLLGAAAKKVRCKPDLLQQIKTVRRSIDARGHAPRITVAAEAEFSGKRPSGLRDVESAKASPATVLPGIKKPSGPRPVVFGAGPAGLMAAYALAECGWSPLLIERGEPAAQRTEQVESFWKDGTLNIESNVLYGEGGAGLFSDGKLTSRAKDRARVQRFLEILVACGASPDILIDAEPHIGSDILHDLVPALRNRIISMGGEMRFGARLDELQIENGAIRGAVISGKAMRTDCVVLATGHSARDIYTMLAEKGVALEPKPFAVGVRIEIPQCRIDAAQWGKSYPTIGKASFRMTRREENDARACYTFCMCPGGLVMSCASSEELITTNGMSLSKRDKTYGNAAFLVPVFPPDFPAAERAELAGIAFQKKLESAAFTAGGSDYSLPAQRLVEFLDGSPATSLPQDRSCNRAIPVSLRDLLPDFVQHTLLAAVPKMLRSLRGVRLEEALVYASETRSSSPVRVVRGEDGQSPTRGLYPCGEGSGYAGGIVSSGIDGLRTAEAITSA
ncbi:MAG: FAD-dependent protein [Kiritimatiellia bacterium]